MSKIKNQYQLVKFILDALMLLFAFLLAFLINKWVYLPADNFKKIIFILISIGAWFISANFSTLYGDRRSKKFSEEIVFIFYTILLFIILFSSVSFFTRSIYFIDSSFFFSYVLILSIFLVLSKYLLRKIIHSNIQKGKLFDVVLIIGATPSALDFYETINKYYYYGYKCIGYINDEENNMNTCPYLGNFQNMENVLTKTVVDEVVISLPNHKSRDIQYSMELCDALNINVRILPDFNQYASSAVKVNNIGAVPVINVNSLPLDKIENKILKRIFDLFFSATFFLTLGFWLLPLIALLIKLTSKGPVFFKQERWGINNQKITCYKFRSMITSSQDIDENGFYNQALKDDSRVTPIGRILRKCNFDELPQFWNVLIGNMSVVGPRPHPTPLNFESMHSVDNYMMRHLTLPGITGWAQVNGLRGETKTPGSMQKRVNYDLYYIHRWTFWLDIQIILQTVINFFRGDQNAY
jgi:putative colanic acid biosynthesis UDP-glucose lipid carrier transferase